MRQRTLDAEATIVTLRKKLAQRIDLHDKDGLALMEALEEVKRLNRKATIPDAPVDEAEATD